MNDRFIHMYKYIKYDKINDKNIDMLYKICSCVTNYNITSI